MRTPSPMFTRAGTSLLRPFPVSSASPLPLSSRVAPYISAQCRFVTQWRTFEAGDQILLKELSGQQRTKFVHRPLKPSHTINTHQGDIKDDAIIGVGLSKIVKTNSGTNFTVHEPTLAEYVTFSRRLVAPIYPDDANVIVNLLDLHPQSPPIPQSTDTTNHDITKTPDSGVPRIDIFECGTGQGALTLYLARAIHAANPPVHFHNNDSSAATTISTKELARNRRDSRNAVIHTLDISKSHSKHALSVVKGFRNGIYAHSVDFHVGRPKEFFAARDPAAPLFSHAVLDMPAAHRELASVAQQVHIGGKVLLFVPSITQILDAHRVVRDGDVPLFLDKVLELGGGLSGGREWSVRFVKSRASMREAMAPAMSTPEPSGTPDKEDADGELVPWNTAETEEVEEAEKAEEYEPEPEWLISCRPQPGKVVQGGGFIGLWTRIESRGAVKNADTAFGKGLRHTASSSSPSSTPSVD